MSLYNMLFGFNALAPVCLRILGVNPGQIPRFRDSFLRPLDGEPHIVIYTRTGGGGRDYYERCDDGPNNEQLRQIPGFVKDEDDKFDCTYASFYYKIPEEFMPIIKEIVSEMPAPDPAERWKQLFREMEAKEDTPMTKRALEVGKEIFSQIEKASKEQKP